MFLGFSGGEGRDRKRTGLLPAVSAAAARDRLTLGSSNFQGRRADKLQRKRRVKYETEAIYISQNGNTFGVNPKMV